MVRCKQCGTNIKIPDKKSEAPKAAPDASPDGKKAA